VAPSSTRLRALVYRFGGIFPLCGILLYRICDRPIGPTDPLRFRASAVGALCTGPTDPLRPTQSSRATTGIANPVHQDAERVEITAKSVHQDREVVMRAPAPRR